MFIEAITTLRLASSLRVRSLALDPVSISPLGRTVRNQRLEIYSPSKHYSLAGVLEAIQN